VEEQLVMEDARTGISLRSTRRARCGSASPAWLPLLLRTMSTLVLSVSTAVVLSMVAVATPAQATSAPAPAPAQPSHAASVGDGPQGPGGFPPIRVLAHPADAAPTRWRVGSRTASTAWKIQHTRDPLINQDQLFAQSCTAADACTAVGDYENDSGDYVTLAEAWNGRSWSSEATPNASGATGSELQGVSCTAADACTAVGDYENGSSDYVTVAEAWNGRSWSIETTPNPSGYSVLDGVSCTAADACTAVGYYFNDGGTGVTLSEAWNGTSWSTHDPANPSGATESYLDGVTCTAADACTAVGYYQNRSGVGETLAEAWNGTSWSIKTTPNPSGATGSYLDGVSCTAADACTAVGDDENSSGVVVTLGEAWNGTSWTIETTPDPPGATNSYLDGVSCTSPDACAAVGSYENSSGVVVTLAEAWSGTSWSIETTPDPSGATASYLAGVSCTSPDACTAVGYYGVYVTLAEAWSGTSWSIETTPDPSAATGSDLDGVSCTSADACIAVGYYVVNSSGFRVTLAEAWSGTSWSIETTPNPSGATFSDLDGVSCTAADACTAVGYYFNSSNDWLTLAEAWNGTSWSIETTPNPSDATDSSLGGVSCTAADACTAVGYYVNSSDATVTLAEAWNGTSWSIEPTPNPSGTFSDLDGVSCTAADACTAVGYHEGLTLAEAWNGTSWSLETTVDPSGATDSHLDGVSCTSAEACVAVGNSENSSGVVATLAEAWNGTSWSIEPTPNASGATNSYLNGVSCTAVDVCTAVGNYDELTLAEGWNGTAWSIETTPNASGATDSHLDRVSCTAADACTAVGYYLHRSGAGLTLAEDKT
jgi:hypothetical protein